MFVVRVNINLEISVRQIIELSVCLPHPRVPIVLYVLDLLLNVAQLSTLRLCLMSFCTYVAACV